MIILTENGGNRKFTHYATYNILDNVLETVWIKKTTVDIYMNYNLIKT